MTDESTQDQEHEDEDESVGRRRTWWHPLLASVFEWILSASCRVTKEIVVGRMPLQVDLGLFPLIEKPLPADVHRRLPALTRRMLRHSLVELKAPTDTLEWKDAHFAIAHVLLWRTHQPVDVAMSEAALFIIAPELTTGFRERIEQLGGRVVAEESRVDRIDGLPFTIWVLKTSNLDPAAEPVLSLFGPSILTEPQRIMEILFELGEQQIASYVIQQIQQLRAAGDEFRMQHKDIELLDDIESQLVEQVLARASRDQRLRGLSTHERLEGISAEELLAELSHDDLEKLRALLEREKPRERNS